MAGVSQEGASLNLMPMLDVFSILITFLLMSFSSDPINHDINKGVELPQSRSLTALDEIPAIIASKTELFVNDKKVSDIIGGDVPEQNRYQGAILPLYQELKKLAEANKSYKEKKGLTPGNKVESLTLEMDKGHNFKLLKRIMISAQQSEFIAFKLMVAKELN